MNIRENYLNTIFRLALILLTHSLPGISYSEDGVTTTEIVIGGVMDLEGRSSGLGLGMKAGIEAALKNETIGRGTIRFVVVNDSYNPTKTVDATKELIKEKVFVFAGNVGTPTAKVSLPILAEEKIPAIGFYTGAGLLRPGVGDIINFRASYVQETKAVIDQALEQGILPQGICAYVQNDAYGMAGVVGIRKALENNKGAETIVKALDEVLEIEGENPKRNGIGPVGVYTRNTFVARGGYDSLKAWEYKQGTSCRLIITVGAYGSISRFIAYANSKNEPWLFSAVSFTGADNFAVTLNHFGISDRVIMTQVVPLPDSDLSIVKKARKSLGEDYGYVSQEGYIVGKLLLYGLRKIEKKGKEITRSNLLAAFRGQSFKLDGLEMDFIGDNQGSDLVVMTTLKNDQWVPMQDVTWHEWIDQNSTTTN